MDIELIIFSSLCSSKDLFPYFSKYTYCTIVSTITRHWHVVLAGDVMWPLDKPYLETDRTELYLKSIYLVKS